MNKNNTAVALARSNGPKRKFLDLKYILCDYLCTFGGRVELSETVPVDHDLIPIYLLMKGSRGFEVKLLGTQSEGFWERSFQPHLIEAYSQPHDWAR